MNLKKLAKQAIEVEKQAISAGFSKKEATDLASEYLRAQVQTYKGREDSATNKEEIREARLNFVNATKLGHSLYERGHTKLRLKAQDVNRLLAQHGLQEKREEGGWTATKEGEAFAKVNYMVTQVKGETYTGPKKLKWDEQATVDRLMSV